MLIVYTSQDCAHCYQVKRILESGGVDFTEKPGSDLKEYHEDWLESGISTIVAELAFKSWDGELPIIVETESFDVMTYQEFAEFHNIEPLTCHGTSCRIGMGGIGRV